MDTTLELRSVRINFSGLVAVDNVDLTLREGEILGLIGPNGAGKTTLVNAISGFQRPSGGRIHFGTKEITRWDPARRARAGIVRSFQSVRLFPHLSVFEHVEVGALASGISRKAARERASRLLTRMGLASISHVRAALLSHGDARRVGVLRALALGPRLLLLDEPGAGLNETESADLLTALRAVRDDTNVGMLIIEHDMRLIMGLCERIQVLDHGKTIATGTPEEVRVHPAVLTAYLGSGGDGERAAGN